MNYKDFFKHLQYTKEAEYLIKEYLCEPIAYRIKAEPGWKLIALGPTDDKYDVEVDFIDIDEWVFFTSLHFTDTSKELSLRRALINSQMEQSVPKIPDNYNGKLKSFFDSIAEDFPNWNHITFPSLMMGCIKPDESFDYVALEKRTKELWASSRRRLEDEEKNIKKFTEMFGVKDDLKSILDGLLAPKVDKTKLN